MLLALCQVSLLIRLRHRYFLVVKPQFIIVKEHHTWRRFRGARRWLVRNLICIVIEDDRFTRRGEVNWLGGGRKFQEISDAVPEAADMLNLP